MKKLILLQDTGEHDQPKGFSFLSFIRTIIVIKNNLPQNNVFLIEFFPEISQDQSQIETFPSSKKNKFEE